jgi:hypothetical protein
VHITISSADASYQGPNAFEMLFHEASHGFSEKVSDALDKELRAQGKLFRRRRFDHAVIFYTAGELARRHLGTYEPYAIRYGIYDRAWEGALPVLEQDWKPYLDGKIDFEAAVRAMVKDYGVPRK